MWHKRLISLIIVLSLLVLTAACSDETDQTTSVRTTANPSQPTVPAETKPETPPDPIARKIVKDLAAKTYGGRLAGTVGNEKAGMMIATFFESLQLEPVFGPTYEQPYLQTVLNPAAQNTKIVITYRDGSRSDLIAGRDFITGPATRDVSQTAALNFQPSVSTSSRSIPVITNPDTDISSLNSRVVIRVNDVQRLTPGDFANIGPLQIQITSLLKDSLQNSNIQRAQVTSQGFQMEKSLNNIVAVLNGKPGSTRAIVLTAHFDHYGSQGDFLFPGALDNASGVGTLLSIADKIREQQRRGTFDPTVDIVFAAVNSGIYQSGATTFPGSKALENALSKKYTEYYQINIDGVGSPTAGPLAMGQLSRNSELLAQGLMKTFAAHEIPYRDLPSGASDHYWFINSGAAAATIGQDLSTIRSSILTDVAEKLDYSVIARIAAAVSEFVVNQGEAVFSSMKSAYFDSADWWRDARLTRDTLLAGRTLAYDEAMYFVFDDQLMTAIGFRPLTSQQEISQYHSRMTVDPEMDGFVFDNIQVHTVQRSADLVRFNDTADRKKVIVNTVFKQPLNPWDITAAVLGYKKGNQILTIDIHAANADRDPDIRYVKPDGQFAGFTLYRRADDPEEQFDSIACTSGRWEIALSSDTKIQAANAQERSSRLLSRSELLFLANRLNITENAARLIQQLSLTESLVEQD